MRFRSNWILEVLVFEEGGKRENRRETSRNKERTNNKLNQHMASTPGFDPGPNWREANAPTTAKPLLPKLFREPFLSYHRREEWWEKGKGETNAFYLFPPFPASCCFNHYCYCFIFGKPVGDSAEERLHKSGQRLRRTKFRLSFLVAERFRYISKLPSV